MSSTLVKRLLRASADATERIVPERPSKRRRKATKYDNDDADAPRVTKEELLASRVRLMLAMDGQARVSQKVIRRRTLQHKQQSAVQRQASRAIVTNSRSTALQATKPHEPTFDKEAHKKKKEQKKLQKIALQLKRLRKKK